MPSGQVMSSESMRLATLRHPWPLGLFKVGLFAVVFAALWPTTRSLLGLWEDAELTTYTHGYLIALISAWLLWRSGSHDEDLRPSIVACVPLAVMSVVWLVAVRAGIQSVHQVLLPAMLWLAIYAALGARQARRAVFAVAFLYFAIPVWGEINAWLLAATVWAVDGLLHLTGVTAYVDGNVVHLAAGVFEIAGGCSGLHFFIVALAIAALYGELNADRLTRRLQLLGLATVLALLTNWLRVYLIILAGYLTDMQHYLVRVEHYRFGWVVFVFLTIAFFLIARRLPVGKESADAPSQRTQLQPSLASYGRVLPMLPLVILSIALGPLWNAIASQRVAPLSTGAVLLPAKSSGWTGPRVPTGDAWMPVFAGADLERSVEYARGAASVQAYAAFYASQSQGKELIHYDNSVLGKGSGAGRIVAQSPMAIRGPATELLVSRANDARAVIWFFYRVGSQQTNSGLSAQLRYGLATLTSSAPAGVVAFRSRCVPDCDAARAAMRELIEAFDWTGLDSIARPRSGQ
jgi:exosortase A